MKNKVDYEQLYYDKVYENRKIKQENNMLKDVIKEINNLKGKKYQDLKKYLIKEIVRYQRKGR